MKINSNTVCLKDEDFENIESFVKKIASDNNISNVESVRIKLSSDEGVVYFKTKEEDNS